MLKEKVFGNQMRDQHHYDDEDRLIKKQQSQKTEKWCMKHNTDGIIMMKSFPNLKITFRGVITQQFQT